MTTVPLAVAIKILTSFDGNKDHLYEFCSNCDTALELLDDANKALLFSIIQTKLTGKARAFIQNRTFTGWSALKEYLIESYSDRRSLGQWQLELTSCKQGPNDSVLEYSRKIENYLIKSTTALDETLTNAERTACVKLLRMQALHAFISGLKKDIAIIVKSQKPEKLEDAIHFAIAEEIEQKSLMEISKFQNLSLRGTKYCDFCKRPGHLEVECRRKLASRPIQNRSFVNSNGFSERSNYNVRNINTAHEQSSNNLVNDSGQGRFEICAYCKNIGHHIRECRKRQYNNSRRMQGPHQLPPNNTRQHSLYSDALPSNEETATVQNLNDDPSSVTAEPKRINFLMAERRF